MSEGYMGYRPGRKNVSAGDMAGGLYSGRSQGGATTSSSSRPITSQSSRLPSILPGGGNRDFNSMTKSNPSKLYPPSLISEWRNDEGLTEWYKNVQNRKKSEKQKSYKQAMKDANWILERRARQMKEIRERQKAEEAEAVRRDQAEFALSMTQGTDKKGAKGEGGAVAKPSAKAIAFAAAQQRQQQGLGYEHKQLQLEWQSVGPIVPSRTNTKDITVWIKPGVFVVKNVLVAPGNIFV